MEDISDAEEYFDAIEPEEISYLSEQEIWEIAGQIGYDWIGIGITLGYPNAILELLEDMYSKEPKRRNFLMISRWCKTVLDLKLDVKTLLAQHFLKANRRDIANSLGVYYEDAQIPKTVYNEVSKIIFDRPASIIYERSTEAVIIHHAVKLDINMSGGQYVTKSVHDSGVQRDKVTAAVEWKPERNRSDDGDLCVYSFDQLNAVVCGMKENRREAETLQIIRELSLEIWYPAKITLQDVRSIKSVNKPLTEKTIPWLLLNKIIMLNYNCREEDLCSFYEGNKEFSNEFHSDESDDDLFEDLSLSSSKLNPSDLFYATFLCCDLMLKQELISKLFICRLAIPFIYKDFNQKLVLTQWGLRKVLINKRIEEKSYQIDALKHPAKRVSFVRIGQQTLSKSRVINEILSDQYHPTFFNRDCPLGATTRRVADGIVEASWFVPSGRQNDLFKEVIMFSNLRGDCVDCLEELNLLCAISHVVVVHTDVHELSESKNLQILLSIHHYNISVIYALSNEKSDDQPNKILKDYKLKMEKYKNQMKFFNLKSSRQTRSTSDITKELRKMISETILEISVSSLLEVVRDAPISDEEMIEVCSKCKHMALDVIEKITDCNSNQKQSLLPLQGELWLEWCKALKTCYRSKSDDERQKMAIRMCEMRNTQNQIFATRMHPFVLGFLAYLTKVNTRDLSMMICYLAWVKTLMDEKSRQFLPELILKYQESWIALKSAKEKKYRLEYDRLTQQVDKAEHDLVAASFGLEHIIREMGQIYEAAVFKKTLFSKKSSVNLYPKIASKLLQSGHSFEIMDGDTAMVPLIWVKAVFSQLKQDIGDQRLLAISVLGIQSSGKSTLLNAMFGLQFPVSAGRCTRGVFVQLVKVDDSDLPYSYVLVIDTEGLRAPELAEKKHMHDNELATFVLGLGNITIINIKGENTSEMEDVLQIAVHAFLRLKMANGRLKLQQSCIFVHQNVPAIDATTAMTHGRQKMLDKLDKMTCEAASQEGLADITSFNQVIEINPQSHMWYFSDLWFGDPPMAPVNLGYSSKVADVKRHILFDIALTKKTFLSISETQSRIDDLWKGILSDDFVFSFRNSLEIKAYHTLDARFQTLTWGLDKIMQNFIHSSARMNIIRCENDAALDKEVTSLISQLQKLMLSSQNTQLESWNNFIDTCSLREIMEQWRQSRIIQLNEHVSELVRKGKRDIQKLRVQHVAELVRTKKKKLHEDELKEKAQTLAAQFKGSELTVKVLLKNFNDMWKKWIGVLEHESIPENKPIDDVIQEILYEHFAFDRPLLLKALQESSTMEFKHINMLKFSFSYDNLVDGDISISQSLNVGMKSETKRCMQQAFGIIQVLFAKLDAFLRSVNCEDIPFEKTYAISVFMILTNTINEHNKGIDELTNFKFTAALKVKLAVHIAKYITKFFTRMDRRYEAKHNIKAQMDVYKTSVWQQFAYTAVNKNDEITMTNLFRKTVEKLIEDEIEKTLPLKVVQAIIDECFSTKYSLMLAIMKDLAENGEFLSFYWYITDAESFARDWIIKFTNERIFKDYIGDSNRYFRMANKLIEEYLRIIKESFEKTQISSLKATSSWIKLFEMTLCQYIPVPSNLFSGFDNMKDSDCVAVRAHFMSQMKDLESNLQEKFLHKSKQNALWIGENPYIAIFEKLWGCNQRCPFCRETCQKTNKGHQGEQHTCVQHRPPGLKGVRRINTHIMSWETCNYKVYSNQKFLCGACDCECQKSGKCDGVGVQGASHFYRNYCELIPDWEIEPSPLMDSSSYWMWFVYTYRKELEVAHGFTVPKEVHEWSSISKEQAVRSLKIRGSILLEDSID